MIEELLFADNIEVDVRVVVVYEYVLCVVKSKKESEEEV